MIDDFPAKIIINLAAFEHNLRVFQRSAGVSGAEVMAILKANAYGHGLLELAPVALECGVKIVGVAKPVEARQLRLAGFDGEIFTWIFDAATDFVSLLEDGVQLSASSVMELRRLVAAAQRAQVRARVHLKVDTGLHRNGILGEAEFAEVLQVAKQSSRWVEVIGLWSHLACGDEVENAFNQTQNEVLVNRLAQLRGAGFEPEFVHIANSAATLRLPELHHSLVRPGIGLFGLTPDPALGSGGDLGLKPVMRLESTLLSVKPLARGQSVSYGRGFVAEDDTLIGLVPLGYADGVFRAGSGINQGANDRHHAGAPVWVLSDATPKTASVAGKVCMDQFVVDLGPDSKAQAGDRVVLWGDPQAGHPSVDDWAQNTGTINYEITTRLGGHIPRIYES